MEKADKGKHYLLLNEQCFPRLRHI